MLNEKEQFFSYNMLARKPLVGGVPLMLGLSLLVAIVLTAFIAVIAGSILIGTIPFTLIICLFVIKFICEDDSTAVDKMQWVAKGFLLRLKHKSMYLTISPELSSCKKRSERINDFFKLYS
ncbi:hypothetical protein [Photobacterium damselae]|uniref:hypothetical protein n=1 Tax=Photobacterium damselae TaxID=38293 RepID=UPI0010FCF9D8|nr:hypothetical protein [Photobacterium damselae]TLS73427.1 hypothetical protein FD718_01925 [Photobacterium damselae subsp. damselae]